MQLLALVSTPRLSVEDDADAGIQEGQLAQPVLEGGEVELGLGEGFGRGQEGDFGAALAIGVADDSQRRDRARRR